MMTITQRIRAVFNVELRNILWLSLIGWLLSIELLLVVIWVSGFVPMKPSPLLDDIMPEFVWLMRPEREMFFYRLFVVLAVGIQAAAIGLFRRRLSSPELAGRLRPFAVVEFLLVFLLLSAGFKRIVYGERPWLAEHVYNVLLVLAVFNKVFWPWIRRFGGNLYAFVMNDSNRTDLRLLAEICFPALIVLLIYIPDPEAVLARMFVGEQFHHINSFAIDPGWSFLKGGKLNIDVFSQYGFGVPIFISALAVLLGGFTYPHIFAVSLGLGILYFILFYFFLRRWLGSVLLAGIGTLYAIKIQMFHPGVYPIVWTYQSATVLRYWFDMLFFLAILGHVRQGRRGLLAAAGGICALQIFYLPTEGIYLTLSFYFYLLASLLIPDQRRKVLRSRRDWPAVAGCGILPVAGALALLAIFERSAVLSPEFWKNSGEFVEYFLSGFGLLPMTQNLLDKNFLSFAMGVVIPLVYVLTLLVAGTLCAVKKNDRDDILAMVLSVYGLGLYHYYVARSAQTSYYTVGLPYVLLLCFWISRWWKTLEARQVKTVSLALLALVVYALTTSHMFIAYPNIFCLSRNPMTDLTVAEPLPDGRSYFNHLFIKMPESSKLPYNSLGKTDEDLRTEGDFDSDEALKAYYHQESDFSQDAALIDRLTPPGAAVPLISSFETKILMQADRRPFFYYFSFVVSRPMHMRTLLVTSLYSRDQLAKTLRQLKTADPEYVFMERIFYNTAFLNPPGDDSDPFRSVMYHVHHYYTPVDVGKFLVAMKRNDVPFAP